jgi:hypothetical protein
VSFCFRAVTFVCVVIFLFACDTCGPPYCWLWTNRNLVYTTVANTERNAVIVQTYKDNLAVSNNWEYLMGVTIIEQ